MKGQLAEQIQIVDSLGINVSSTVVVYSNADATTDDVSQAIDELVNARGSAATPANPVDVTVKMVNPDFEQNANGWEAWVGAGGLQGKMYQVMEDLNKGIYRIRMGLYTKGLNTTSNSVDSAHVVYANQENFSEKEFRFLLLISILCRIFADKRGQE